MTRDHEHQPELVELGVASAETQGRPGPAWEITGPDLVHGIQDR